MGCDLQFPTFRPRDAAEAKAMAALPMPQVPRRSWADGYGFYCSIHCPGVSPVAPPACAPAFAPWEVCAALEMWVIPAGRVSSPVPLPGEPGKGRRVRHFRAKPFLRCEQRCLSLAVGTPSPALLCSLRSTGTSPRHRSSARPSSCKASATACALPGRDVHPGPCRQRGSTGILDQKSL